MGEPAAEITIVDETSSQEVTNRFQLTLASERLSARELIERRVREEVERHNRAPTDVYHGLVQPEESERLLNGYRLRRPDPLAADPLVEAALRAFEANGFVLLLDDRQVEDLDEQLVLTGESLVRFVRLVPLVGG
ncbi:MAG: hypothetical protein QNK04_20215 [Myxococcota bacterium]|nr:hypothetical protein [Myxococcota bacterium]